MIEATTTVAVLLYGDYPELAERCLSSVKTLSTTGRVRFRVGLNEISDRTREVVDTYFPDAACELRVDSESNIKKYPMMRRLLYDEKLATPYLMWFDDDSFLRKEAVENPGAWLSSVEDVMSSADIVGAVYSMHLRSRQPEWIVRQPWYRNKEVRTGKVVHFVTGGWWTARTTVLEKFNWPPRSILHRGGDVMLGELVRQNNLVMRNFRKYVAINADENGAESKSPRRGFDEEPIGSFGATDSRT